MGIAECIILMVLLGFLAGILTGAAIVLAMTMNVIEKEKNR